MEGIVRQVAEAAAVREDQEHAQYRTPDEGLSVG